MEYNLQQFERDFMGRTKSILTQYHSEYDATLLLNCLVGLLIVPRERLLRLLPDEPLSSVEIWGIPSDAIVCVERGYGKELGGRSIRWFVISLRNAVAHFHVLPIHESGKVVGFEFWDRSGFRVQLNLQSMRQFVELVSTQLENVWSRNSATTGSSGNGAEWSKQAKLYTYAPTERVYIIDCPDGLQRQCYEISSSTPEYYIVGCNDDIPKDGATDVIIEPDAPMRQAKIIELALALSNELPKSKRLSVYTNDEELMSKLRTNVADVAKARLSCFMVYNIQAKRPSKCPRPVIKVKDC